MLESLETKETEKLRILHLSKHFIVIDKPFDVIINSDEPDRVSVHSLLKDQFPDLTNDNLKVSTYLYSIQIKGSLVSEDIFNRVLFPCVFGQKALFQVLNKTTLTFSREKTKFQNKNKVILKDIIHIGLILKKKWTKSQFSTFHFMLVEKLRIHMIVISVILLRLGLNQTIFFRRYLSSLFCLVLVLCSKNSYQLLSFF